MDLAHEDDVLTELAGSLSTSVAALRATLESLAAGLGDEDPRTPTLHGAIEEMTHLARRIHTLVDYASPRPIATLSCTLQEILASALGALDPRARPRVCVARDDVARELEVDGPLFARCLGYLLEVALQRTSGEVLLQVRQDAEATVLAVVEGPAGRVPTAPDQARDTAAGLRLALRDVERMGGRVELHSSPRGATRSTIVLPARPRRGDER